MIIHQQDIPPKELNDKALQQSFYDHTGMSLWSFINDQSTKFTHKRNRKIWTGAKYELELSPRKATISKL